MLQGNNRSQINQSKVHKKANMSIGGVVVDDITQMKRGWGVNPKQPSLMKSGGIRSMVNVTPTGKALKPPP